MTEPTKDELAKIEAEHGPVVVLSHPDGSCFAFKALDSEQFEVRETRVMNGDADADEKMLIERCVWPSRADWNKYLQGAAFEVSAYVEAYQMVHGGKPARRCEPFEVPEGSDPSLIWITNGEQSFGVRRPTRPEVKMYSAKATGRVERIKGEPGPAELLMRMCGTPEFCAWLDRNRFGIRGFGDAFVTAFGAGNVRVSGK